MGSNSKFYQEIISKLEALVRKEFFLYALLGIQAAVIIGLSLFLSFALIEFLFNTASSVRTVLFFLFLLFFLSGFLFLFIVPLLKSFNLFRRTDYYKVAGDVGKSFPDVKDDLLNAMQLVSVQGEAVYSQQLVDAAFLNVYNNTKDVKFESIISFRSAKLLSYFTIGAVLFLSLILFLSPGMQAASGRLIHFNKEFIPPAKFSFVVSPGSVELTKGDDIFITVQVLGEKPGSVFIAVKDEDRTDFDYIELKEDSLGNYNFERRAVRASFNYFAAAGNVESDTYLASVIDRPVIKTLDLTLTPPAYSKMPVIRQKDNGNITGLPGSNVSISLSSTKYLTRAELIFNDSASVLLNPDNENAQGNFRIRKDDNYKIILTDTKGNQNQFPIIYSVKALYDSYPVIEVIHPNRDVPLANDNRLPLLVKIADDYGFSRLTLHYRLSYSRSTEPQENFSSLDLPVAPGEKEQDVNYIWNLTKLSLSTNDVLTYYLEIFDNDNVSGPKSAKTGMFNVRVPSLDEILARADETHNAAEKELMQTLKEAEELKKELDKLDQELKKDQKEITWDEKEKIEKAVDKFEELQDKVESITEQLKEMHQDLQQNNLLSEKTLEKYMELQKMMEELTSEEMKKAMERLQDALQKLNRQEVQQAMQNMKIDEEQFQKSIERTINLLKRVQIEQKIDELKKRIENSVEKQDELKEQTDKSDLSDKNKNDELSKKQDEISKELEKLRKDMEDLAKKMENMEDMPSDKLEEMMDEFDEQKNTELSEKAEDELKKNQKQQAMESQQQLSQNMQKMKEQMQQMQDMMMQMNQMQTFTDMMKALDNLINLSKQQEELRKESQRLEPSSSAFNENAQKQNSIQRSLDKVMQQLAEISQKTFAVTPEMGKALGEAKMEMNKSLQAMQNRNGSLAANSQAEAMKSLNEAASLMKSQMEGMMQGGGQGGGMMSLMQQLNQMGQQQMNLHNLTQQLQQQQQGQLSQQQQAELQRLAQQQELIRKSAEQLNKEARESGKSKTLPGNLEQIARQMQEIITDMKTERIDDQLLQKQERILSRLLDAQRSINERDFEKQRESNTGENIARQSPADLNLSTERGRNKIQEELNKAVNEGYSKDYENLIRKYYELLQKEDLRN
jgi:hypothetical protein